MARGFCVDCNYEGSLSPTGDCSRCGSEWTTGGSTQHIDLAQFEDLDKMNLGGRVNEDTDLNITTGEFYIL
jgi:hypothetical protein